MPSFSPPFPYKKLIFNRPAFSKAKIVKTRDDDDNNKRNHTQPYLQTREIKSKIPTRYILVVGNPAPLLTDTKCFNDHIML
jgi:hypothetical protein